MAKPILPPFTEEAVFTVVYRVHGIQFRPLCEEVLRISSVGDGPLLTGSTTEHVAPKWQRVRGFLRKLSNQSLIEYKTGWYPAEILADDAMLSDMLSLVLDEAPLQSAIGLGWTPWDRAQAMLWASNAQLAASDNASIRQQPLPQVLKQYYSNMKSPRFCEPHDWKKNNTNDV